MEVFSIMLKRSSEKEPNLFRMKKKILKLSNIYLSNEKMFYLIGENLKNKSKFEKKNRNKSIQTWSNICSISMF